MEVDGGAGPAAHQFLERGARGRRPALLAQQKRLDDVAQARALDSTSHELITVEPAGGLPRLAAADDGEVRLLAEVGAHGSSPAAARPRRASS